MPSTIQRGEEGQVQILQQAQRFRKVQISRHAQHFRTVRYRFRGRRNTFGGQVQISQQAQDFRKARSRFRGRRHFRISGAAAPPHDVRGSDDSTRGALSSASILQISRRVGGAADDVRELCKHSTNQPHDVRRSDDSTKGGDDRRSDDSAKGA